MESSFMIENLYYTIPVMSVHTEDKEVQCVRCCPVYELLL